MARETKVGLLTGLAFIICFAIILANRGRQEPGTTHWPYLVDGGANVQRAARDLASEHAGRADRSRATTDDSARGVLESRPY